MGSKIFIQFITLGEPKLNIGYRTSRLFRGLLKY